MAEIGTDIEKAKQLIIEGKLVAMPTDTVYGLAGDMMNEEALANIFKTKNRPQNVPLIALSNSFEKLENITGKFSPEIRKLAALFWPGGLTIILKKKKTISDLMTAGLDTLGVRIPNHPLALDFLKSIDHPLAVTSANIHGQSSPVNALEVKEQLGDQIDYILDGGECSVKEESTIIGIESGKVKLYRSGAISLEQIQHALSG